VEFPGLPPPRRANGEVFGHIGAGETFLPAAKNCSAGRGKALGGARSGPSAIRNCGMAGGR
jgi:hypothetical protein